MTQEEFINLKVGDILKSDNYKYVVTAIYRDLIDLQEISEGYCNSKHSKIKYLQVENLQVIKRKRKIG